MSTLGKTTYLADLFLNAVLTNGSFSGPATIYAAMNTSPSTPTTPGTEVVDAHYARLAVTWSPMVAGSTTAATIANSGNFFTAGASTSQEIVELALYDAATGGHELYFAPADILTLNAGEGTVFAPANLTLTEAGKPNALSASLVNALLRAGSYTGPVTVYAALNTSTSTPTTPGAEVVDANYTRQAVTFGAAAGGMIDSTDILSNFSPSSTSSHTIVEVAIYDAPTGGNELYYGVLATPKTIGTGDQSNIPLGMIITESTLVTMLAAAAVTAGAVTAPTFSGTLGSKFAMGGHLVGGL